MRTISARTHTIVTARAATRSWDWAGVRLLRPPTTYELAGGVSLSTCAERSEPASAEANSSPLSTHVRPRETSLRLEEHLQAAGGDLEADGAEDGEVGDVHEHAPGELAGGEAALEGDALVERRAPHDPLQPRGVLGEREERRREEEHRDHGEVHEV